MYVCMYVCMYVTVYIWSCVVSGPANICACPKVVECVFTIETLVIRVVDLQELCAANILEVIFSVLGFSFCIIRLNK
jgi:hypothetical protein